MKTLLASTAILAATVGIASAEVAISGSARMGIIDNFGDVGPLFSSRVRINFSASGETDAGLAFGASVRADQSGQGNTANDDSTVYVSGGFGRLTMGDVDGAANAAVGQVSGVGYTGLGDLNEIFYLANGGTNFQGGAGSSADTSVLYEYGAGSFTGYVSATQRETVVEAESIAGKYAAGNYTLSLGYERATLNGPGVTLKHIIMGASATFGGTTVKLVYGQTSADGFPDMDQLAASVDYTVDDLTMTAFYKDNNDLDATPLGGTEAYGFGASYDLGGGASIAGGYSKNKEADTNAIDLGLKFSF